jgi:hypothetical protein
MAKAQIGAWEVEEAELERQHQDAQRRGARQAATEPRALSVRYDEKPAMLVIELTNGVTVTMPVQLLQGVAGATEQALSAVALGPRGASIHWEGIGADFSVAGLLAGIFGTHAWMAEAGRRGGSSRSPAKAAAARANGKKGGRPEKALRVAPAPSAAT